MLFELLVAVLDRVDTQTLLHVTRLGAGLDWPLRALFGEVQRRRALSPLETRRAGRGHADRRLDHPGRAGAPPTASSTPAGRSAAARPGRRRPPPGARRRHRPRAAGLRGARTSRCTWRSLVTETLNDGRPAAARGRHRHGQEPGVSAARGAAGGARAADGWSSRRRPPRSRISCSSRTCRWSRPGWRASQPLRATVLKGRANYLCLRRWQTLLHAGDLTRGRSHAADQDAVLAAAHDAPATEPSCT